MALADLNIEELSARTTAIRTDLLLLRNITSSVDNKFEVGDLIKQTFALTQTSDLTGSSFETLRDAHIIANLNVKNAQNLNNGDRVSDDDFMNLSNALILSLHKPNVGEDYYPERQSYPNTGIAIRSCIPTKEKYIIHTGYYTTTANDSALLCSPSMIGGTQSGALAIGARKEDSFEGGYYNRLVGKMHFGGYTNLFSCAIPIGNEYLNSANWYNVINYTGLSGVSAFFTEFDANRSSLTSWSAPYKEKSMTMCAGNFVSGSPTTFGILIAVGSGDLSITTYTRPAGVGEGQTGVAYSPTLDTWVTSSDTGYGMIATLNDTTGVFTWAAEPNLQGSNVTWVKDAFCVTNGNVIKRTTDLSTWTTHTLPVGVTAYKVRQLKCQNQADSTFPWCVIMCDSGRLYFTKDWVNFHLKQIGNAQWRDFTMFPDDDTLGVFVDDKGMMGNASFQ